MHVWVIEVKNELGVWEPTSGVGLTREAAKRDLNYYWKHNEPEKRFRVKKYISA